MHAGRLVAFVFLVLYVFVPGKAYAAVEIETAYSIETGPRFDNLNWSIAGDINGENPNVLSELTWTDLKIAQIKGDFRLAMGNSMHFFYLRAMLDYGEILAGDNQDSDYWGDNRTLEFSRSNNNTDGDYVSDASFGFGYQLRLLSDRIRIAHLLGYSSSWQNLRMTDGFQTVPFMGSFEGLDSTYQAKWSGPWIGLDFSAFPNDNMNLFVNLEYHRADYYAEANWNLREDFSHPKSYEHEADGTGIVASVGGAYLFNENWSLKAYVYMQKWSTEPGIYRVFTVYYGTVESLLNEVNWESFAAGVGVTYTFKGISRSRRVAYY